MKKSLKLVLIFFAILLAIGVVGRYGWRLFGFRLCAPPESYGFYSLEVEDGVLVATGYAALPTSLKFGVGYGGYIARQEGSTLYIGIRKDIYMNSKIFFRLEIPVNAPVEKIILTDSKSEVSIYDRLFEDSLAAAIRCH